MSDYQNDYSNFSFEPVDDQSRQNIRPEGGAPKQKKHLGAKIVALALCCALLGGAGGAGAVYLAYQVSDEDTGSTANTPVTGISATTVSSGVVHVTRNDEDKSLTPADVYASYVESVVGISCQTSTNVYGQISTAATSGTGFVLTSDGYIITNNHVIDGADEGSIKVSLMDGTAYDAVVVGTESDNDLALLKIDAAGLKAVSIGDSDQMTVGEQVCAIGNPLGELTASLTVGYVSALDREINTDGTPINMLQTDCAINPGNSGGPLFDMNGNVIGITTAKYASDEIEGLGFAIPINDAMEIITDLMNYGYVTGKAYMGITPVTISETYSYYYNMPTGVYVYSVESGSAAEIAGIKQSDVITKLGDTEIGSYTDLSSALREYKAGDTTSVTVWRSGEEQTLTITFDEKKPQAAGEETEENNNAGQQSGGNSGGSANGGNPGSNIFGNIFGFGG